jgi:hypothetical protein
VLADTANIPTIRLRPGICQLRTGSTFLPQMQSRCRRDKSSTPALDLPRRSLGRMTHMMKHLP